MKIKKVHCLFEQSGTFKKAFKNLGIDSEDYDIQNEFGETDHVIDLFAEIEKAYEGQESIFDTFGKEDLVMAFFPCVRFDNQIMLSFRGQAYQQKNWSLEKKMLYDMELLDEVRDLYHLVNKLFLICITGGVRLIMENPYSEEHFLRRYWCFLPSIVDTDRRMNGDYFKKPTQYWFLNCTPEQNVLFEPLPDNGIYRKNIIAEISREKTYLEVGAKDKQTARSMIHPDYADRFIRQFILEAETV